MNKYDELKQQYYAFVVLAFIGTIFLGGYAVLILSSNQAYPTFRLVDKYLETKDINSTMKLFTKGDYDSITNHINVYVGSNPSVIFHEYAHYIWYKKLTDKERSQWEQLAPKKDIPGYDKNNLTREWFAIAFATYVMEHRPHDNYNYNTIIKDEHIASYLDNIYSETIR